MKSSVVFNKLKKLPESPKEKAILKQLKQNGKCLIIP